MLSLIETRDLKGRLNHADTSTAANPRIQQNFHVRTHEQFFGANNNQLTVRMDYVRTTTPVDPN